MHRQVSRYGILVAVAAFVAACWIPFGRTDPPARATATALRSGAAAQAAKPAAAAQEPRNAAERLARLRLNLARPITVKAAEDGTLQEILEWFTKTYQVPFLLDSERFKSDVMINDVDQQKVKLPAVTEFKLAVVLQIVLDQVQGAYLLRPDHVEITTRQHAATEIWGEVQAQDDAQGRPRPRLPVVQAAFNQQPLGEALRELVDSTGHSVVLDTRRAADKAGTPVTAILTNVPLDTAVRVLASQARLQPVLLDDVLLVTTADHARRLEAENEKVAGQEAGAGFTGGDAAVYHRLQQRVSFELEGVALRTALQDLSRQTETKVVLDPKAAKEGDTPVTLRVKDISVETALRLLPELAGLKPVLVGDVVFVTHEASAVKLQAELFKPLAMSGAMGNGVGGAGASIGLGALGGGGGLGGMMGATGGFGGGFVVGGQPASLPITISNRTVMPGADAAGDRKKPAGPKPPDSPTKRGAAGKSVIEERTADLRKKLLSPVPMKAIDTTLRDVLDFITEKTGVTFIIDTEAFKTDVMIYDVDRQMVKLATVQGIPLSTVLQKILAQVQGTYLLRPGYVEVTTMSRAHSQTWGDVEGAQETTGKQRPFLALVQATFDGRPLAEALAELRETTGYSVVLDANQVGEAARAPVTATLYNVPLDTAVRLLADQAGLEAVLLDDVLYVTTPENAQRLRAQQEKANRKGLESPTRGMPPAMG